VLSGLSVPSDPRVLVDYRTSDDAGVYRLSADTALVQTVDFFTPIVDDPYLYGQIAAANALSDLYAMGALPLTALAVAAFPATDFDPEAIEAIFRGGLDKLEEAGVALLGGHTVQDQEVKFGYAVTGTVHPSRVIANAGAQPGDVLVLTKPLGTGVITTALKFDRAPSAALAHATTVMRTLNREAGEIFAARAGDAVHACTDVTGFGLLGHACELASASAVTLEIDAKAVPLISGAYDLATRNRPGGAATNLRHFGPRVVEPEAFDDNVRALLHDPQTSGGLLVAVAPGAAADICAALEARGVLAARIGHASEAGEALIRLR
jgi:selenide,water dikinase